jgi:hypothetical protein
MKLLDVLQKVKGVVGVFFGKKIDVVFMDLSLTKMAQAGG